MSKYLLLGGFNNYFNRINKKLDTKEEYIAMSMNSELSAVETNFMTGDHIQFNHIFNFSHSWAPDYLLILDKDLNIVSRWYVIEWDLQRGNQYIASLLRDSISDNYEAVINAPIYLEKGYVDKNNALLYNPENMSYNQIKKSENLLTDTTGCPWLVLYLAKNATSKTFTTKIDSSSSIADITLASPIESSIYSAGIKNSKIKTAKFRFNYGTFKDILTLSGYQEQTENEIFYNENPFGTVPDEVAYDCNAMHKSRTEVRNTFIDIFKNEYDNLKNALQTDLAMTTITEAEEAELINADNKVILDSNGKYFRLSCIRNTISVGLRYISTESQLFFNMYELEQIPQFSYYYIFRPNNFTFQESHTYYTYTIVLTELPDLETTLTIDPTTKQETNDADFNIIALPYSSEIVVRKNILFSPDYITNKEVQLAIAQGIAQAYTSSVVYDMQILPYCPFQNLVVNGIMNTDDVPTKYLTEFEYNGQKIGFALHCPFSNFTFNIQYYMSINSQGDTEEIAYKIDNETKVYRLCSPNYNGLFEFSLAKNEGIINYFNVDCSYKPYSPYIHVNPNFKGLYGNDFNDCRGLICGGDFSIPIINEAFTEYELRNKNYQIIFDRKIQNLELNQRIEKEEAIATGVMGVIQGGTSGAAQGSMVGGAYGAIIGAAIGTATSSAGFALDMKNLGLRQAETKDYAKDMYNYNLGNIKALPYSLSKISSFNYNNKYVPFLEIYSASDNEIEALRNKIKYNGMTLNAIMTIQPYLSANEKRYFKGQLIRLEEIDIETQQMRAIYAELMKGVFM